MADPAMPCAVCGDTTSKKNMARHMLRRHGQMPKFKGLQEWCPLCPEPKYVNHQQRNRHFKTQHPGHDPTPLDQAYVIDPTTLERVVRKARKSRPARRDKGLPPPPDTTTFGTGHRDNDDSNDSNDSIDSIDSNDNNDNNDSVDSDDSDDVMPRSRSPTSESIVADYLERLSLATPELLGMIKSQVEEVTESIQQLPPAARKSRARYPPMSRNQRDFLAYAEHFQSLQEPQLITAEHYGCLVQEGTLSSHRHQIVVTSTAHAHDILTRGPPQRCIVVPAAYEPVVTKEDFLDQLAAYMHVDVQEQDALLSETRGQPSQMNGDDTIELIHRKTRINLLNLSNFRSNPTPPCIATIPAYDILTRATEDRGAGKKQTHNPRDFTNCASFQIFGCGTVWSPLHHDHYGMLTTIFCEFGEKCWLVWPQLTDAEKAAWKAHGYGWKPPHNPTFIHLRAGDLLIMPSNTPHAPYTMTDCLMTGTQHLHSASMHTHLAAALYEREFEDSTNEDEALEAVKTFRIIEGCMLKGIARWPWPTAEEIDLFRRLLDEYEAGASAPAKRLGRKQALLIEHSHRASRSRQQTAIAHETGSATEASNHKERSVARSQSARNDTEMADA